MTACRQASIWAFHAPMASRSKRSCTCSPNSATQAWPRKRRVVSIGTTRWKRSTPPRSCKTRTETAAYHAKRTATSRASPSGRSNRNPTRLKEVQNAQSRNNRLPRPQWTLRQPHKPLQLRMYVLHTPNRNRRRKKRRRRRQRAVA